MDQVGPKFCLCKHEHSRTDGVQKISYHKRQIERKVKDVFLSESFAGKFLAGESRCRNKNAAARKMRFESISEPADGQHLTYRYSVNPDRLTRATRPFEPERNHSHALLQSRPVFSCAQHAE